VIRPDVTAIFGRHEFAFRRLHSFLGLIPVGMFLFVHFVTNVSILDGPETFQMRVGQIHSLGPVTLSVVEWSCILLPILLHGTLGLLIVTRGKRNVLAYPYLGNVRYTLERWTGVIAFAFIIWHVFDTRGWIQTPWWTAHVTHALGGGTFDSLRAAATATATIQGSRVIAAAYLIGVLACVYHFANGLWTMGITWGAWTSPSAQRRATVVCAAIGLGLAAMGLAALWGMETTLIP
jgi:succinate dehydrogenase / fumarate reductase, cytochrome b subunit